MKFKVSPNRTAEPRFTVFVHFSIFLDSLPIFYIYHFILHAFIQCLRLCICLCLILLGRFLAIFDFWHLARDFIFSFREGILSCLFRQCFVLVIWFIWQFSWRHAQCVISSFSVRTVAHLPVGFVMVVFIFFRPGFPSWWF